MVWFGLVCLSVPLLSSLSLFLLCSFRILWHTKHTHTHKMFSHHTLFLLFVFLSNAYMFRQWCFFGGVFAIGYGWSITTHTHDNGSHTQKQHRFPIQKPLSCWVKLGTFFILTITHTQREREKWCFWGVFLGGILLFFVVVVCVLWERG